MEDIGLLKANIYIYIYIDDVKKISESIMQKRALEDL